MSTTNDLSRILISAVAALIASATCLVAAAGPAVAAAPTARVVVVIPATTGLVGAVRY